MLACEFLAITKPVIMPQSSYSPDLGPAEFFLLTNLKIPMKGKCVATVEEMQVKSKQDLLTILKSTFQRFFED